MYLTSPNSGFKVEEEKEMQSLLNPIQFKQKKYFPTKKLLIRRCLQATKELICNWDYLTP